MATTGKRHESEPRAADQLDLQRRAAELMDHLVAVLSRHNVPAPVFGELSAFAQRTREAAERELSYPPIHVIDASSERQGR